MIVDELVLLKFYVAVQYLVRVGRVIEAEIKHGVYGRIDSEGRTDPEVGKEPIEGRLSACLLQMGWEVSFVGCNHRFTF